MTEDKLSFLDQPRDDKGRFASSAEPAAAEPQAPPPEHHQPPPAAPEPPTTDTSSPAPAAPAAPPGYIPLAAALDDRDKRQAAERERDELRRWIEANAPKQQQMLDPLD